MQVVVGIFAECADAMIAARRLGAAIPQARTRIVASEASIRAYRALPADETEQPGMGPAIGSVVVGGFAAALATLLMPPTGALAIAAIAASAVAGAGGGMIVGQTLEDRSSAGLTKDEILFYEKVIRRGECSAFVFFEDRDRTDEVREVLSSSGARSLDAAREAWEVGLHDPAPTR